MKKIIILDNYWTEFIILVVFIFYNIVSWFIISL